MDSDCIRAADRNGHFYPARPCHVLLFLAAGLLKRTPDLPTSLAVAALLLLVPRPQRILDAGFQLSFSAVLGIAVMIPVLQDGWEDAAPSLRVTDGVAGWNIARTAIVRTCRLLRKNILAGLGITMTMLPFLLIHFYEWSPWSVLLNLAVIPLMGILLPCLIGLQLVARLTAFTHCLELPQHLLCTAIEAIFPAMSSCAGLQRRFRAVSCTPDIRPGRH